MANPRNIVQNIKSLVDTADVHPPMQQNFAAIELYLRQLFELVIGIEEDDYYKYHIAMAQCDVDDQPALLRNMLSTKISALLRDFFDVINVIIQYSLMMQYREVAVTLCWNSIRKRRFLFLQCLRVIT